MEVTTRAPAWKILGAFAIIYLVWGSTFLAIRVGVLAVPPLLFAGLRFATAGAIVSAWSAARGERWPDRRQWTSLLTLSLLIFVCDYGLLFWAERRVPSGVAAVMMATIPVFTALAEIVWLGTQRLTGRLALALLIGIGGVAVLMSGSFQLGEAPIDHAGAIAILGAGISWSLASVLSRKLPLPASKGVSAGAQMLVGGAMLFLVAWMAGEFPRFDPAAVPLAAWLALVYLIVAGSIVAFTVYVWLIHRESPTKVGTYAYVNPVVAVLLGYYAGGEALGRRTVIGALCVLVSVVVIVSGRRRNPVVAEQAEVDA